MAHLSGSIEYFQVDAWHEVVQVDSLLFQHSDLNGCLFGVDNFAQFDPLFDLRGIPPDLSDALSSRLQPLDEGLERSSWVLWSELKAVDWNELALTRDQRITEFAIGDDGREEAVTKWLSSPGRDHVREMLDRAPNAELVVGPRVFRRLTLQRKDALLDTEFPLVMKLMECLAGRFGGDAVRLVVWFD